MTDGMRQKKDQAALLLTQGQWESALTAYRSLARAEPGDLSIRQKVAEVLRRLGRREEASAGYLAVAEAWAARGDLARARALVRVALELDAAHARARALLAYLSERREGGPEVGARGAVPVPEDDALRFEADGPLTRLRMPALATVPLFSSLGLAARAEVLAGARLRVLEAGEVAVREGAPGDTLFAVMQGRVAVVRQSGAGGREVARLERGDVFGELALFSGSPRLADVVAEEASLVLELPRTLVVDVASRHPSLEQALRRLYAERLGANLERSHPGLAASLRRELGEGGRLRSVAAGELLLARGRPGRSLHLLLRGRCTAFHGHVDGRETHYRELGEGDVLGEVSVLLGTPVTASVRATTACTVLVLDRVAVEQLTREQPALGTALWRMATARRGCTARLLSGLPVESTREDAEAPMRNAA